MNVNDQIVSLVRSIIDRKQKRMEDDIKRGSILPKFDLRDYTDEKLIYGIRKIPEFSENPYGDCPGDIYNLGRLMTYETVIPDYVFFKFKDMYKVLNDIHDECGFKTNFKEIPLQYIFEPIFDVLSNRDKYYRTLYGFKRGYRICIFLYAGWEYSDDLNLLAQKFKERDIKEAKTITNYYNSKLAAACLRIEKRLDERIGGAHDIR